VVPAPYWVSVSEQLRLAGVRPVFVTAREDQRFKLTARISRGRAGRRRAVDPKLPVQPTGACYDRRELAELAESSVDRGLYVLADGSTRSSVRLSGVLEGFASLGPETYRRRTVLVTG